MTKARSPAHLFAVDLGASSGRTVLARLAGQRLAIEETHRFANGPLRRSDGLFWDADRLLTEIARGLRRAGGRAGRLDGIAIDTWGVDYALLDADGAIIDLPRHYRDTRTRGMMARAFRRVEKQEIYRRTGIQFMELNTIYQLMADAASPASPLRRAERLLFMPDLVNYHLAGAESSDETIASTSQLYDQTLGAWATELMDRLGLPARIMPDVRRPGTVLAPMRETIAAQAGLHTRPLVIAAAGHDTACAVAAVPALGDGWAYISSGTWSLIGIELDAPRRTDEAMADNFTNEAGVGSTTRFLRNVAGLWLVQECQRAWREAGHGAELPELITAARHAEPFRSLIDPDDGAFVEPGDMPRRIADWCAAHRQASPQTVGQFVRCILESLALKYRLVLERLEHYAARPIQVVHVVGGGSQNDLLNQFTADASGRVVVAGPAEATVIGNALLQALALGLVPSPRAIRRIVAASFPLRRFEPRGDDRWKSAADTFASLVTSS